MPSPNNKPEILSDDKGDRSTEVTSPPEDDIWYFGFGPIVHPQVRARRGIVTYEEQPAVLSDHRLTFSLGSVATIVPRIGFTVHGVLMKLEDNAAWQKLKAFDSGQYEAHDIEVYPYQRKDCERMEETPDEFYAETRPVPCYSFVTTEFDESVIERNVVEKKPQERYLRLISTGMLKYGVDPDYVSDEIEAVPFLPSRKEEDWASFPMAKNHLPQKSMGAYQKMCQKQPDELYFVLRDKIIKADTCPHENAVIEWMRNHGHGKGDITMLIHTMIIDPHLPWAKTKEDLSDRHYHWVENHMFEYLREGNITATVVYRLKPERNAKSCGTPSGVLRKVLVGK